ncbi:MAG: hypothetical protein Fur0010_14150 [Bdellovibrio sp.]
MGVKKLLSSNDENGQALFELIVFLPLMIFMLTIIFTVGNSINASINQVKATRRYFYYLAKGNSRLPDKDDLNVLLANGFSNVSMSALGWRESFDGSDAAGKSYSSCYKINTLFSNDSNDECKVPAIEDKKTQFIRIYTGYGICGEDFVKNSTANAYERNPTSPLNCVIAN